LFRVVLWSIVDKQKKKKVT